MGKRLIGTTEIELTNTQTGETTKYTDNNMITGRLKKIYGRNPFGACLSHELLPISSTTLGGLVLFENEQAENVNNDLLFDGYRVGGTLNSEETGALTDEEGFQWVWDFTEEQGNGYIEAVGLAHKYANLSFDKPPLFLQASGYKSDGSPVITSDGACYGAQAYDVETSTFYNLTAEYQGVKDAKVKLTKAKRGAYNISLFQNNSPSLDWSQFSKVEEVELDWYSDEQGPLQPLFSVDGGVNSISFRKENGVPYFYIFSTGIDYSNGYTAANKLLVTKLNLQDNDLSQTTLTISGGTIRVGDNLYNNTYDNSNTNLLVKDYYPFIGDYVYLYSGEADNLIYKVNINDETDIHIVEAPGSLQINSISGLLLSNDYGYTYAAIPQTAQDGVGADYETFEITNDIISICAPLDDFKNSIVGDETTTPLNDSSDIHSIIPIDDTYGIVSQQGAHTIVYFTRYKATINNLSTPISKTISEKMKITYIIREVEET